MTAARPIPLGGGRFAPPPVSKFAWDNLVKNEIGDFLDSSIAAKLSFQVEGEFGGAVVNIEGSNDGEHWYVLIDSQENHMRLSYPGLADVGQMSAYIRPSVVGGNATTSVSVFALARGI